MEVDQPAHSPGVGLLQFLPSTWAEHRTPDSTLTPAVVELLRDAQRRWGAPQRSRKDTLRA